MSEEQLLIDEAMEAHRLARLLIEGKVGAAVVEAVPHLRRAADSFGQALRSQQRAEVLTELGRLLGRCGDHGEALVALEEAVRIFRELGQKKDAANAGIEAALAHKALGKTELATGYLERAMALLKEGADLIDQAQAEITFGAVLLDLERPQEALEHFRLALPTLNRFSKRAEVAHVHELMAVAQQQAGDVVGAARDFEIAIGMKQEQLGDMRGAAKTMSRYADLRRHAGQHAEALALYQRALSVHKLRNDQALIAQTLGNIGTVHALAGDRPAAIEHYRRCIDLSEQAGERASVAQALYNLAGVQLDADDAPAALGSLEKALAVCEELGSRQLAARILAAMGPLHEHAGDTVKAEACRRRRCDVLTQLGATRELREELEALLGEALAKDDHERTAELTRQLLTSCAAGMAAADVADHRLRQGTALARLGDHPAAVEALAAGLPSAESDPERLGRLLRHLGASELQIGASADGLAHYQRAAELHRARGERKQEAVALVGIGNALAQLGRKAEAKTALEQAAAIRESLGDDKGTAAIRKATNSL